MIQLVLKKVNDTHYCFSNPKIGSENEEFSDKVTGTKIILEYLRKADFISRCNALELFEEVTNLSIPLVPQTRGIDQLEADEKGLEILKATKALLQKMSLTEKIQNLPTLQICNNCNQHAMIIGWDFMTCDFDNQKDGVKILEGLFEKGEVNRPQREKILGQIEESGLPIIGDGESAFVN